MKNKKTIIPSAFAIIILIWWIVTAPPSYIKVAPAYMELTDNIPEAILSKQTKNDFLAGNTTTIAKNIAGYDEVILFEKKGIAFATGMDGWFWKVNLKTKKAERFVKSVLNPAGARLNPINHNQIYFCAAKLYGKKYDASEKAGVYRLDINTKKITPVALYTPNIPEVDKKNLYKGIVYKPGTEPAIDMNSINENPVVFCNDLDISADGNRIYFSEPFAYEGASMGGGAFQEAISLGRNGRLWQVDLQSRKIRLIAHNLTFIDGVLLDETKKGKRETSILISETVKFRIVRIYLSGPRSGTYKVLWHSLPGMPDGLDRDEKGRIWVGLVKKRTKVITWVHKNPWIKPFLMRLPHKLLPVPHETGILTFDSTAKKVLFYTNHMGSSFSEIPVVVPGKENLYLPNFNVDQKGFHFVPYPKELQN